MRRFIASFILAASLLIAPIAAFAQNATAPTSADLIRITRADAGGGGVYGAVGVTKVFDATGIGYSSGSAVTQITSRTTGVTINAYAGAITLVSAAGSATAASFVVTDSKVNATDTIVVAEKSGTDLYNLHVTAVAAGSFKITFYTTGGVTVEQPVINFAVVRSAAS